MERANSSAFSSHLVCIALSGGRFPQSKGPSIALHFVPLQANINLLTLRDQPCRVEFL